MARFCREGKGGFDPEFGCGSTVIGYCVLGTAYWVLVLGIVSEVHSAFLTVLYAGTSHEPELQPLFAVGVNLIENLPRPGPLRCFGTIGGNAEH